MKQFFHIRDGNQVIEDDEGREVSSRAEMLEVAAEMVTQLVRNGEAIDGMTFEVIDGKGSSRNCRLRPY